MTGTRPRVFLRLTLACCVLAGCGPAEEEPDTAAQPAGDSVGGVAVFNPAEERQSLPTSRIYYTLTDYGWYERGRPLVHDGRGYRPQGMPLGATLGEMQKAGEFEGVEYYIRSADPGAVVYVPVFDGYWQAFQLDPSASVTPVNGGEPAEAAADSVPPDSSTARD